MSLYVEWLNLIKSKPTAEWLTDGQRSPYDRLVSDWLGAPFVNLVGPPGSGKSFIAHLLARDHGYGYATELEQVRQGTRDVVLDSAEYTRLMRPTAHFLSLGRVILATRRPVKDPMPRAEIRLGERDVRQFLHNLHVHCEIAFVLTEPAGTNFARIIQAEAVAKGEEHVDPGP